MQKKEAHTFWGRNRRPLHDLINNILSLAYTFWHGRFVGFWKQSHSIPILDFLYGIRHDRKSFALYLVEDPGIHIDVKNTLLKEKINVQSMRSHCLQTGLF